MPDKARVRNRWQIALYVPRDLKSKIMQEAHARHRGYGPTVLEILREYFEAADTKSAAPKGPPDVPQEETAAV